MKKLIIHLSIFAAIALTIWLLSQQGITTLIVAPCSYIITMTHWLISAEINAEICAELPPLPIKALVAVAVLLDASILLEAISER